MKITDVKQGSKEWLALRQNYCTASEAQAMMGASKYMTRDDLMRQVKTGVTPEVTPEQQALFDRGHATESAARKVVEGMFGEEFFPITAISDKYPHLLASFDGVTMMETILYEHKLWNERLAADVRNNDMSEFYYWQLEQQLLVSGAEKVIFVVSDGTEENFEYMEYYPVEGRAERLLKGWEQFQADLADYTPQEVVVEPVALTIESLPALNVQITGGVTKSNLTEYETSALKFIRAINTDLKTDQDFADADAMVKFCGKTEKELDDVKQAALNQTSDIADLFKIIDTLKAEMRTKRLSLEKLVKAKKQSIREGIVLKARRAFSEHMDKLNARVEGVRVPDCSPDFAGVIKNKRTIESLQNAVNTEIARCKIEANESADNIEANLKALKEIAGDYGFLFRDLQQIITKDREDLLNLAKMRITEHKQAEEARLEVERERIRQEEERKAEESTRIERERIQQEMQAKTRTEAENLTERQDMKPEPVEHGSAKVVPLQKAKPASAQPKTLMEDVAYWCDAWAIHEQAANELVEILESHVPVEVGTKQA